MISLWMCSWDKASVWSPQLLARTAYDVEAVKDLSSAGKWISIACGGSFFFEVLWHRGVGVWGVWQFAARIFPLSWDLTTLGSCGPPLLLLVIRSGVRSAGAGLSHIWELQAPQLRGSLLDMSDFILLLALSQLSLSTFVFLFVCSHAIYYMVFF